MGCFNRVSGDAGVRRHLRRRATPVVRPPAFRPARRVRTMRIGVVGATGRTGRQVVEQALARGADVLALARHPEALPRCGPGMASAAADVLDREVLAEALAGTDAVVSALGIG